MRVAEPAIAAAQQHHALARRVQVGQQGFRSSAKIWVPTGTLMTTSGAPAPVRSDPAPLPPFGRGNAGCSGSRSAC